MPSSDRVLVTGAYGFIGRHLIPLLRSTVRELTLVTRSGQPASESESEHVVSADLTREPLDRIFESRRPQVVIHLAGARGGPGFGPDADECFRVNVVGTLRLLQTALAAGIQRLVFVGSAEEYGRQSGPVSEETPCVPETAYGISKLAATLCARAMLEQSGLPVVIVRPFTVYGPGQPPRMFVAEAVQCAVEERPFRMSTGTQRRDFVYVEDAARAIYSAATTSGIEGRVFNVGGGAPVALRDAAQLIRQLSSSGTAILFGGREAASSELHDTWADISLAERLLGWRPTTTLEEGLERTIAWARSQAEEVKCG